MKKHELKIIINRDFADVMHRCRIKREFEEGTWISNEMGKAYHRLYEAGYALSVEVMEDGELGGGLYSAFGEHGRQVSFLGRI